MKTKHTIPATVTRSVDRRIWGLALVLTLIISIGFATGSVQPSVPRTTQEVTR